MKTLMRMKTAAMSGITVITHEDIVIQHVASTI